MKKIMMFVLTTILLVGCDSSSEPDVIKSISLSQQYTKNPITKISNDLIQIEEATMLLRDIKYKTKDDASETGGMFKTSPMIMELDIAEETHSVGNIEVPAGEYHRLEFNIHKAVAADTLEMDAEMKSKYQMFLEDGKFSVIIKGNIEADGTKEDFVYKSSLNVKQKVDLDEPLVVNDENPTGQVLMQISSAGWFTGSNGEVLDPRDSRNNNTIDKNIRESIHLKKR